MANTKKITILANFVDIISRIEQYDNETIPYYMHTKDIDKDNDTPKEELAKLFTECLGFDIEDEYITFTVKRDKAELDNYIEEARHLKKCNIAELKKKCNLKEEYRTQIEAYLIHEKLDWILEEIK